MRRRAAFIALLAAGFWSLAGLGTAQAKCPLPYAMVNGQVPDATQMMANFNALVTCLNAGGTANAIQYNAGAGSLGGVGPLTDGQLLIGSAGNPPQAQALTAGAGISIANGAGSVTIAMTTPAAGTGLFRQVMSPTPTSASTGLGTWLNQGAAAVSDSATGMTIDSPLSATTNLRGRYKSAPASPYTITALLGATGSSFAGIGWYDGTAKLQVLSIESLILRVRQFTNPTTLSAVNFSSFSNFYTASVWLRLQDDGTTVSFSFSQDGINFMSVYSIAKASGFLGASGYSNVVFFVVPPTNARGISTLLSWSQN
jgi:hypothetical protein